MSKSDVKEQDEAIEIQNDCLFWRQRPVTGTVPVARHAFVSVYYKGRFFLIGGYGHGGMYLSDSWTYDCETANWSWFDTKASQIGWQLPALHSAATCLHGSRLYAFGGITQKGQHLKGLMELDLTTGIWTALTDEQGPQSRWGATLVSHNQSLYLFGGYGDAFYNDLWKFTPSNDGSVATISGLNPSADGTQPRWEQLQPAGTPPPRHYHCSIVFGDRMYIFGGYRGSTFTADIWAYEFLTNRWVRIDGLSGLSNRRGASCVLLPHRNSCAIMGGRDDKRRLNDLIEFKFDDHKWTPLRNVGDPPQSRVFHSGFLHERSLYFFGGLNIYNTNDMLEYVLEPLLLPTPRSSPSLVSSSLGPASSRGDRPQRTGKLIYYPEKTYGGARIDFSSLVFSDTFSDVTFVVKHSVDGVAKEDKIPGHRCILYAASPHFKRLFDSAMKEASDGIIEISDLVPEILREVLHFIYTGRLIRLTTENVADILQTADKFLIYELVDLIITSLSLIITRDNITHIITLSSSVPSASEGLLIQCINFLASDPLQPNFIDALNLIEDLDGESHLRLKKIHDTEKARVEQRERILAARKALANETAAAPLSASGSSATSVQNAPISSATASSSGITRSGR